MEVYRVAYISISLSLSIYIYIYIFSLLEFLRRGLRPIYIRAGLSLWSGIVVDISLGDQT